MKILTTSEWRTLLTAVLSAEVGDESRCHWLSICWQALSLTTHWLQEVIICSPDLIDPQHQVQSLFLFLFPFRMLPGFDFWPFKSTDGKAIGGYWPSYHQSSTSNTGETTGNVSSLEWERWLWQAGYKFNSDMRGFSWAKAAQLQGNQVGRIPTVLGPQNSLWVNINMINCITNPQHYDPLWKAVH